jgi:hypothetical protein
MKIEDASQPPRNSMDGYIKNIFERTEELNTYLNKLARVLAKLGDRSPDGKEFEPAGLDTQICLIEKIAEADSNLEASVTRLSGMITTLDILLGTEVERPNSVPKVVVPRGGAFGSGTITSRSEQIATEAERKINAVDAANFAKPFAPNSM